MGRGIYPALLVDGTPFLRAAETSLSGRVHWFGFAEKILCQKQIKKDVDGEMSGLYTRRSPPTMASNLTLPCEDDGAKFLVKNQQLTGW